MKSLPILITFAALAAYSAPLTPMIPQCTIEEPNHENAFNISGFTGPFPKVLSKPTGKYGVGVFYHNLVDVTRNISIAGTPTPRLMELIVFYPTDQPLKATTQPQYISDYHWQNIAENYHISKSVASINVSHWATERAPPSKVGKLPVLLFSHGTGVPVEEYTTLCQDIASTGRVVIQITHSGFAVSTPLQDDLKTYLNCTYTYSGASHYDPLSKEYSDFMTAKCGPLLIDKMQSVFENDIRFVLDNVQTIPWSPLTSIMDLETIGVSGHSIGGMAATSVSKSHQYANVKFGLNFDGGPISFGNDSEGIQKITFKHFVSDSTIRLMSAFVPNVTAITPESVTNEFQTVIPDSLHTDFQIDTTFLKDFTVARDIHCKTMDFIETHLK